MILYSLVEGASTIIGVPVIEVFWLVSRNLILLIGVPPSDAGLFQVMSRLTLVRSATIRFSGAPGAVQCGGKEE